MLVSLFWHGGQHVGHLESSGRSKTVSKLTEKTFGVPISFSILGVSAVWLFCLAITDIPLADATTLIFIAPVIVSILSPLLLGESVGIRRWAAVIIGFFGILLIIQPGFQEVQFGTFAGLGSGFIFALFQISTRTLVQQETPLVTVLYTAIVGALTMNILIPEYWVTPQASDGVMLLVMAVFAACGQALLIYAFVAAPAVVVAPFFYFTIIVAKMTGYLAFGDFPNLMAWGGIAVLVYSGIYIAFREAKVKEATF